MVWCFSTRASVATVLTTHPCVSRCLRVNNTHCCFFVLFNTFGLNKMHTFFKCSFFNENAWIKNKNSLKYYHVVPIDYWSSLVQVVAWRQATTCTNVDQIHASWRHKGTVMPHFKHVYMQLNSHTHTHTHIQTKKTSNQCTNFIGPTWFIVTTS